MALPSHARTPTRALALCEILFAALAAHAALTQNDQAKIANLRKTALEIPLQNPVWISLFNGQRYAGRLTEITDNGVHLLLRWDRNVETRDFAYSGIRSLGIEYGFKMWKRTLQNRLFEVEDGSLVELSLRGKAKIKGIIDDYGDQTVVLRVREAGGFSYKEIPVAEIKSFSVKSRAQARFQSDPMVLELMRKPAMPPKPGEETASQESIQATIPIVLRLLHTVSSVDAAVGDRVDFVILTELALDGRTLLAKGGSAWGHVMEVVEKGKAGRSAEVRFDVQFARTPQGDDLPLRAFRESQAGNNIAGVITGMAAVGFVFLPIAPLGLLLAHGFDTAIPKGTMITAYLPLETIPSKAKR